MSATAIARRQGLARHQPRQQALLRVCATRCTPVVRGPGSARTLARGVRETWGSISRSESIATRIPAELLELILGSLDDDDCVAFGRACPFFRDVAVEHLRVRFKREMVDGGWCGDRVICAGDWSDGGGTHLQALSMASASAKEGIITVAAVDECRCYESRTAEEGFNRLGSSARIVFPLGKYHERKVCFEVYWEAGLNGAEINVPLDEGEAPERGNKTFETVSVICIHTMVIDSQLSTV